MTDRDQYLEELIMAGADLLDLLLANVVSEQHYRDSPPPAQDVISNWARLRSIHPPGAGPGYRDEPAEQAGQVIGLFDQRHQDGRDG